MYRSSFSACILSSGVCPKIIKAREIYCARKTILAEKILNYRYWQCAVIFLRNSYISAPDFQIYFIVRVHRKSFSACILSSGAGVKNVTSRTIGLFALPLLFRGSCTVVKTYRPFWRAPDSQIYRTAHAHRKSFTVCIL